MNIVEEVTVATADCKRSVKFVIGDESKYRNTSTCDSVTHL